MSCFLRSRGGGGGYKASCVCPQVHILTISIFWWQHSLQSCSCSAPTLIIQIVAGAIYRTIFVRTTVGRPGTRVCYHSVQNAECGQSESALVRTELESASYVQ